MEDDEIVLGMGYDFFHSVITGDENNSHQIIHSVCESGNPALTHNFLCVVSDCLDRLCEFLVDERPSNGDTIKKLMDRISRYKVCMNREDDLG